MPAKIAVVIPAYNEAGNIGSLIEETIAAWEEIAPLAREAGIRAQVTISVSFGCPFEGEVPESTVLGIARHDVDRDNPVRHVHAHRHQRDSLGSLRS